MKFTFGFFFSLDMGDVDHVAFVQWRCVSLKNEINQDVKW